MNKSNKKLQRIFAISFIAVSLVVVSFAFFTPTKAHAVDIEPVWKMLKPKAGCGTTITAMPDCFEGMGAVTVKIWGIMMQIFNSIVLAILIFVAFMNILRIQLDSYAVKKFLPTFIMAIILANFSFLIARIVLDAANVVMSLFILGSQEYGVTGAFDTIYQTPPPASTASADASMTGVYFAYLIKQLLVIVASFFIFILAFIYLIRNYYLYFLVAISPLAFLSMMLPMTKKYFQQWWSQFGKWAFMPVISLFWLWLASQFMGAVDPSGGTWILPYAFAIFCFYMAITSPQKVGGAAVGAWANFGKKTWGKTGGAIVKPVTKWAGAEIKERATDAGLRARLAVARTAPYKKALGDNSTIGKYRSKVRSNTAERRLRLQGPQMVREKLEKDAKVDAAYRLSRDPRTPDLMKKRMVAVLRGENSDERKTYEQWGIQAQLDELKFNADGTLVTSDHNDGTAIPVNAPYTENMRKQMGLIEQLKYQLRRRNQLDPHERPIADNIIAGNPVNASGAPRVLSFWSNRTGGPVPDIRRMDPSGYNSSAVPMTEATGAGESSSAVSNPEAPETTTVPITNTGEASTRQRRAPTPEEDAAMEAVLNNASWRNRSRDTQTPTATAAPAAQEAEVDHNQRVGDMSEIERLLSEINDNLQNQGQGGIDADQAAAGMNMPSVGVGIAKLPDQINVKLTGIDLPARQQLELLQTRIGKINNKELVRLQSSEGATLQRVAKYLKENKSPEEIQRLVAQGRELLAKGDIEGAKSFALQLAPEAETSLNLSPEKNFTKPEIT